MNACDASARMHAPLAGGGWQSALRGLPALRSLRALHVADPRERHAGDAQAVRRSEAVHEGVGKQLTAALEAAKQQLPCL